jgi:hypothetical protein
MLVFWILMALGLWVYFYTMGISIDPGPLAKAKLPHSAMIQANGARTGIVLGPLIVAHHAMPIRLDASGNLPHAMMIGLV